MNGAAALAVARIWEALSKLERTQALVITARSNTADIGIHVNTATNATTDAIGAQLQAITELREAIQVAQTALIGTENADASASLVWLNQVQLTLEQDSHQLTQLKSSIVTLQARANEIVHNHDDSIKQMLSAVHSLRAHITRLG